jgi:signal transduction histidine kinase
MILVVIPLVILIGHLGVPSFTRITPYWKNPTVLPATAFLLLSIISFLFLKKNKYMAAIHLYVYGFIFTPIVAVILDQTENPSLAGLMVGGVIVSSVMFHTRKAVYISGIVTILAVLTLFLIIPDNAISTLFYSFSVIITLIALILIFKIVNDNLEKNRRQSLTDLNTTLQKQTIKLEEEIEKRKLIEVDLMSAKEKAEESDQLKSAFLASMNHELRTPLTHILGFSRLIQDASHTDNIKNYSSTIHNSGQHLLAIIEDIFSLAMSENMTVSIRLETVKVKELMDQLAEILKMTLKEAGKESNIKAEFVIDPSLANTSIAIDRYKVIQVITNLIHNGVKFTDSGSISIEIFPAEDNKIAIWVSDTGIGIAKDKQDIIFESFRQESQDTLMNYGGLGVGLAISKRIVDAIEGDIQVYSELGKGSRFVLHIPQH